MSNARDDKDGLHGRRRKDSASTFAPLEEIAQMHYSTENYSTAIEYFNQVLEQNGLEDFPDRHRLLLRLSDCYRRKGDYSRAKIEIERARELLDDSKDCEALGQIEYREAFILFFQGHYDAALRLGSSSYRRLKESSEHSEVAYVQLLLANCYQRLGLLSEAEDYFSDSLSSYRRVEDRVGIAYVYNSLGLLHKNACRWNRALASLSKSLELSKSLGLTQHLMIVELNLGAVHLKLRRFSEALTAFSNSARMAERFGDQYKLTLASLMQGRTYAATGEFCKAEKNLLRGQALANEHGYKREIALADEYMGELMIARGKHNEALVNLNKGLEMARDIAPEGDMVAEILRRVADVRYELNEVDAALETVDAGIEIARSCGELYEIGYFYRTKGMCHSRQGDNPQATAAFQKSIDAFSRYSNAYEEHRSQQQLARLWLRGGQAGHEEMLRAKQLLNDSALGFGKLDETQEQMLSHLLLAIAEEKLGNLDDALLSIYEADRLAEESHNDRYKRVLYRVRSRIERKMTRDTSRVLDQIPMFGDIQSGAKSRDKLVKGLASSLRLMIDKLNASGGFVAIQRAGGGALEVATADGLDPTDSKAVLGWFAHTDIDREVAQVIVERGEGLREGLSSELRERIDTFVFQRIGFEGEDLGLIAVAHDHEGSRGPISQEALHFVGAYARLISLSVYELIRNEKRREPKQRPTAPGFERIVTENNDMIKLLNLAERVAHSNATVLLQGETGTGKGLIAYATHLLSDRRDKRFVHVNCAAMPESLLESELFGHVKGAFTGAHADKLGLLREADGGTIFLDEIGKTSLPMQGKLLQFLDSNTVRMVGSNELIDVNVRVICASKSNLLKKCQEGTFLEDFFYRINDFPLVVPPLRKRREDIELLFFHYLRKHGQELGKAIDNISDAAMERLKSFRWPGNVRELEKVVKRAVILADNHETLDLHHLPAEIVSTRAENGGESVKVETLRDKIDRLERQEIQSSLDRCGWNKSHAALDLGISYPSLLSKIKRYNLRAY